MRGGELALSSRAFCQVPVGEIPLAMTRPDPFAILAGRIRAWEACGRIPGCDKAVWRQDLAGRVIRWSDFGDRFSNYGWELLACRRGGMLSRRRIDAVHWRGVVDDDTRHLLDLSRAA